MKLTVRTPERLSTVFIVNFRHIPHVFIVFSLMTLNKYRFIGSHPINLSTLK